MCDSYCPRVTAAAVALSGLDLTADGETLTVRSPIQFSLSWAQVHEVLAPWADHSTVRAATLLNRWLEARALVHQPVEMLAPLLRVFGIPASHPLHPGEDWVMERVHGDCLHLGFGVMRTPLTDQDPVLPVPLGVWASVGTDPVPRWGMLRHSHERMGEESAIRFVAEMDQGRKIRPAGSHDVVTLLGTATLRETLVMVGASSMVSVSAPTRTEGWLSLQVSDREFAHVLATSHPLPELGFPYPVLVTREEVVTLGEGRPHG